MTPLLEVEDLHAYIQQFHVLQGVSFSVERGKATVILGRNGVGKTTLFRTILNVVHASQGRVMFDGKDVTRVPTHKLVRMGVAMVPSSRAVFSNLTVEENLRIAYRGPAREYPGRLQTIFGTFPELERAYKRGSSSLSGGEREMLAIACGLVNRVQLLMLDEPSEGLSPIMVKKVMESLNVLKGETTVLLVEQNFNAAKLVGDSCYFMDKGQVTYETTMKALEADGAPLRKYLGVSF